jgi:hypothetical protein
MLSTATNPNEYLNDLPEERKPIMTALRSIIIENLPNGFEEIMSYGMLSYVVPHSLYPSGYHCDPKQPLPFMSIASQKNFVAVYHLGLYADNDLLDWFKNAYTTYSQTKLDMVKSCIRFKKINQIPFKLMGELAGRLTLQQWITLYESKIKK